MRLQTIPHLLQHRVQQAAALGGVEPRLGFIQRRGTQTIFGVGAKRTGGLLLEHRGAAAYMRAFRHRRRPCIFYGIECPGGTVYAFVITDPPWRQQRL